jgi:hypothetical protein
MQDFDLVIVAFGAVFGFGVANGVFGVRHDFDGLIDVPS